MILERTCDVSFDEVLALVRPREDSLVVIHDKFVLQRGRVSGQRFAAIERLSQLTPASHAT